MDGIPIDTTTPGQSNENKSVLHTLKSFRTKSSTTCFILNNKASSVRQWPGRPGFNPRSRHAKDFKNGTWYLLA